MPIVRVIVRGVVQGVGFRDFVMRQAETRHVAGWVRNRRDHTVEAVFSGTDGQVNAMIDACRKGPAGSRVDDVAQSPATDGDLALRHPGEIFSWLATA
jgi:acylphosphatase